MKHDRHDAASRDSEESKTIEDNINVGLPSTLKGTQLGIWRVISERKLDTRSNFSTSTKLASWFWTQLRTDPVSTAYALTRDVKAQAEATHIPRLVTDIYRLGPALFCVMVLSYTLSGVEDALLLWLNNRVMSLIETGITSSAPDGPAILRAVLYRVGAVAAIAVWRWFSNHCTPILKARAKLYFQERLMQAHLSQDLSQSQEASASIEGSPLNGWWALQNLMGTLDVGASTLSSFVLLANLVLIPGAGTGIGATGLFSGLLADSPGNATGNATIGVNGRVGLEGATTGGGPSGVANTLIVLALCLAWPLANRTLKRELDHTTHIAHVNNRHYLRAKALYDLATNSTYKREVVSGTMATYVRHEHEKARTLLGAYSDDYPFEVHVARSNPFGDILLGVLDDLPLIYYAISAVVYREGGLSISSLAMLHQTLSIARGTLERVLMERKGFRDNLRQIRSVYLDIEKEDKEVQEAGESMERNDEVVETKEVVATELDKTQGIGIELRNVTFHYPSSGPLSIDENSTSAAALRNVSFTLPPSSLVVIVGSNGSGKSSLVNLLCNLHYPTAGMIFFDGTNPHASVTAAERSRAMEHLQRSTTLLTQSHSLFPAFTIYENIAIGDPVFCLECAEDRPEDKPGAGQARLRERVEEAARLGGALEFIKKREKGFEEVIQPVNTAYSSTYPVPEGPLKSLYDKLEAWKDISGGEEQRLAAARTFMRLMSSNTRLVVVDEPSSAMDPLGEFELFEGLRGMRQGKTMVFVTHRFGHLTKYADVILCMKSGELVESGTHQELMAKGGEYSKLYAVQARAFTDATKETDSGHVTNGSDRSADES